MSSMLLSVGTIWRWVRVSPRLRASCSAIGHLGDLNDLMVLGALAGAEMAMRDVGIDLTLGSGVAAAQAHFRKTIMAKEKEPTEQERFAQTHPEGVFNP
jgi:alanine-glyoxylate transaminase / serine-glyoxylate transaminase / serine-pyruvate transaminase